MLLPSLAGDGLFVAQVKKGSSFEWELRHLITLQFVNRQPGKGMGTLFSAEGQRDVKEHLLITWRGLDYLRVFEEAKVGIPP